MAIPGLPRKPLRMTPLLENRRVFTRFRRLFMFSRLGISPFIGEA
jgi:hypothetical protein